MSIDRQQLENKFKKISPYLNEKTLRIWAATEAISLPRGGVSLLSNVTGLSRTTIHTGISELDQKKTKKFMENIDRTRQEGAGRKKITKQDNSLLKNLERLLDDTTRGDPMRIDPLICVLFLARRCISTV